MTYPEAIDYLFHAFPAFQQVGAAAYKPGLQRAMALDRYYGMPHRRYHIIHVAGTNGKGSVSHMTASMLQQAGYRVGLFTSPHLRDFRERIRINGIQISETDVVRFVEQAMPLFQDIQPSFFEITSAMALQYFADNQVDFAVIETGMGGRLDSTNIVTPLLSVITNIGLDHTAYLGDTLAKIAAEKAGIIKPGVPVIIGESHPETDPVFRRTARDQQASIRFADTATYVTRQELTGDGHQLFYLTDLIDGSHHVCVTDLQGQYQRKNIVTVYTVWKQLSGMLQRPVPESLFQASLRHAAASTGLCGRWQILCERPYTVCDIAHNAHGFKHIAAQLQSCRYRHLHVVFGMVSDKDIRSVLQLLPRQATYYFTQAAIPRALPAGQLQREAASFNLHGNAYPSVREAVEHAKKAASPEDMIYIGGSTFVVAEIP